MGVDSTTVDLNRILGANTPITLQFSGVIGTFASRDGFSSELSARLTGASLQPEALAVHFPLFSAGFNGTVIVRSNDQIKNAAGVQYIVRQAIKLASGSEAQGVTTIAIGAAGDVVDAPEQQGSLFPDFAAWMKKIGDTLGAAVQWIIVLLAIGLIVYLLVVSGAFKAGVQGTREAFA